MNKQGTLRLVFLGRAVLICLLFSSVISCAWIPEAEVSGFRPLNPPVRIDMHTDTLAHEYPSLVYELVPALTPRLTWEAFPGLNQGGNSDEPFIEADLTQVSNVTYEVRIWEAVNDTRGDLVYEAAEIEANEHTVAESLKSATKYFWSVRCRFEFYGSTRVSEWSMAQVPYPWKEAMGRIPEPNIFDFEAWRQLKEPTARDVARRLGHIPSINFFRFQTPG